MPFPIADGASSPVLDELLGGPAAALTAVALVVAPGARASGWGARAAIALAQRWQGPRRLLLADLDLAHPVLHEIAGVANDEGVVDVVEYGVSIGRLIRAAGGGTYDLLPAGLFAPDPGAILRHDGWTRVLMEVIGRRGTLLAWVPADADGVEAVVERAGAVVVLAEADEARAVVDRLAHPYAVLAILTPDAPVAAAAGARAADAPEAEVGASTLLEPGVSDREGMAASVAVPDVPAPEVAEPDATEPEDEVSVPEPAAGSGTLAAVDTGDASDVVSRALRDATHPPGAPAPSAAEPVGREPAVTDAEPVGREPAVTDAEPAAADAAAAEASASEAAAAPEPAAAELAAPEPHAPESTAAESVAGAEPDMRPSRDRQRDDGFERIRLPSDPAEREALIQELRDRQRAARLAGATEAAAGTAAASGAAADMDAHGPGRDRPESADASAAAAAGTPETGSVVAARPPAHRQRMVVTPAPAVPRFRRPILWTVAVVLLASLLAGAWHFLGGRLQSAPAVTAPEAAPSPPAAPVVQNALPFVVALEAHRDLASALTRVADLTEMEPRLRFHIEALEREGTLFYHVMAGPVADSSAALALRDTLIARGHKTAPTPTDVRATPLAYLIGDYATEASAAEQREVLRRLDIPAYVLRGEAADGQPLYRLYVGGFATEAEAGVVGQMLRAAGIRDTLVARTGTIAGGLPNVAPDSTMTDSLATRTGSSTQ